MDENNNWEKLRKTDDDVIVCMNCVYDHPSVMCTDCMNNVDLRCPYDEISRPDAGGDVERRLVNQSLMTGNVTRSITYVKVAMIRL